MLAANEAVAETLAEHHRPALYRIHEQPNPMKVEEFTVFAGSLGLTLPDGPGTPQWFGRILDLVASTPKEYIVNNLLLRTMQRARYSPDNVGHFGLAASHYTHFTSPIRRYPDLMVHRTLAGLEDRAGEPGVPPAALTEAGDFLSEREKNATEAEWEMVDRLKVRFMADKVGEIYHGVIAGVTSFGLFVELLEWFISGAVNMASLDDDHYSFDEKKHRLIGNYTGRVLQLGDLVRVQVASVEVQQRRIDFVLLDEERPSSRKKQ
jgi:ribonuclease R